MSDIDTVAVDSLKALDPKRPIREADICGQAVSAEPAANDPLPTRRGTRSPDQLPDQPLLMLSTAR